ncbi:isoprenyl transferase [Bacteroidia bacterium]|nr:isoprenyl transferase [Bacteroidia bacterium]
MGATETVDVKDFLPKHIAIIMDGNGRWASQRGLPRNKGHEEGAKAVRRTVEAATEIGIDYLTLYAFSTENWSRPKQEVEALMALLVQNIHSEVPRMMENDIRLQAIGNLESLDENTRQTLMNAIQTTAQNKRMTLTLALSYGARYEITAAVRQIVSSVSEHSAISPDVIAQHLYMHDAPDPDLLIRTGGEHRVSNFLLWQIAYTELYFTDVYWPDFDKTELQKAIQDYSRRQTF